MDGDPGEGIYRAMIEEMGMPRLSPSATALGIRKGKDIVADQADQVHRPSFQPRGKNGLSCSCTITSLPGFALPVEWGGSNGKTVVWRIDEADLGPDLIAQDDAIPGKNRHVSIGPATTMAYETSFVLSRLPEASGKKFSRVEGAMDLKDDFLTALRSDEDYDSLLELVHRHQAQGLSPQEAYEILHRIWLEFGFDKIEEGSRLQDNLEYVMEKIWYECPARSEETRNGESEP